MKKRYLYILSDGVYYKVGISNDYNKRFGNIQSGNAKKVVPLWIIECEDAGYLERCIHRAFFDKKVRGEWYEFNYDTLKYLRRWLLKKGKKV